MWSKLKFAIYFTLKVAALLWLLWSFGAMVVHAQELPDAPKPKPEAFSHREEPKPVYKPGISKLDRVELGSIAAAEITDYAMTARGLSSHYYERDHWIIGKHPNDAKLAVSGAAEFVIMYFVVTKGTHAHNKVVRWLSRTAVAGDIGSHVYGASTWVGK